MTTIHENLVPTIPSGTLPQTPAAEWADNVQDSLGAHVTRTPVGTPGPKVPGGWNDAVEPPTGDVPDLRTYIPAQEDVQRALAGAKSYLPQGVAAYLPGTDKDSGAVDIGHAASVPYTEGGAQPYSTAVDMGPATGAPYTEGGAEPYGAGAGSDLGRSANATSLNETAGALVSGAASTLASAGQTAKAYLPEGVAAYLPGSPSSTSSPQTPQPTSGTPVDLAPASTAPYTHSGVAPYGAGSDLGRTGPSNASSNADPPSNTAAASLNATASTLATGAASAGETARAYAPEGVAGYLPGTSSPQPSASGTEVDMAPASTAPYTHSGVAPYGADADAGAGSDLGVAANATSTNATSTSANYTSNPNVNGNGNANTTSTALLIADARARGAAPAVAISNSTSSTASSSSQQPAPAPAARATSGLHASHPAAEKQGSAALNSGREEDNVPTGDSSANNEGEGEEAPAPAPARATSGLQASHPAVGVEKQGSAALNSGREEDNVPTGEDDAEGEDDDVDADEEKTGGGKGKKGKKGKLMQRFKEKMHVGGS